MAQSRGCQPGVAGGDAGTLFIAFSEAPAPGSPPEVTQIRTGDIAPGQARVSPAVAAGRTQGERLMARKLNSDAVLMLP
jgi:hypothetical protein